MTTTAGTGRSLLSNAMNLSAARLLPMVLGFGSWLLAAHAFPAEDVGLASAAVAAALLAIQVALLGLGTATVSRLPRDPHPHELLDAAVTALAAAAAVAAVLLLGLAHLSGAESARAAGTPLHAALFIVLVVAGTLALYVDHVFVALRRADQAVIRGLVHSVCVLGGIGTAAAAGVGAGLTVILASWAGGAVASLAVGMVQLQRSSLAHVPLPRRLDVPLLRNLLRTSSSHHLVNLTERAPGLLLPILVTEMLSPEQNAAWYAVWMIVTGVYLVPASVGLALQAHAASPAAGHAVHRALHYALALGTATALGVLLVSSALLDLLGDVYEQATGTLWLLLPAVLPVCVVQLYLGLARATGRLREAALLNAVSGVVLLLLAGVGASAWGLLGVAAAWLGVQVLAAVWCWPRLFSSATSRPAEGA